MPPEVAQALATPVAALRERFAVWGCFQERLLGGAPRALRSHLELIDGSAPRPPAVDSAADLVAVMMNPGGSRPLQAPDAWGWAPTLPDRTQYQLMRLALAAQALGWPLRHIRVLNLSDLRTPKSGELFATLAELQDDRHSLFSASRCDELQRSLGPPSVPVLRAWGMSVALAPWAERAVAATQGRRVLGLTDNGTQYRHPLPQRADLQQAWLQALAAQLPAAPAQRG